MDLFGLIIKQLVITFLLILVFWGLGRLLLKKLNFKFSSGIEEFFFASCTGMALSVIYLTILSITGFLYKFTLLFLLIGLLGLKDIKIKQLRLNACLVIFLVLLPILYLTLSPPVLWDEVSYHLPISQSLITNHKLIFDPVFTRFPLFPINGELLFTLGLSIDSITAKIIPWISLFILCTGCYSEFIKRNSSKDGALAVALLISNPFILLLSTICYVDIILALFITASVIALMNFVETKDKRWLYLSGLLLGIGAGTKYIALYFLPIMLIILIFKSNLKSLAVFLGIFVICASPWYIRNLYYSGNPIWPFLPNILGLGNIWSLEDYKYQLLDYKFNASAVQTILSFITLPFLRNCAYYEFIFNIFIWIGLSLIIFMQKKSRDNQLFIIFLFFTFLWLILTPVNRYYVPAIPIICILSASGVMNLLEKLKNNRIKICLFILIIIINLYPAYVFADRAEYSSKIQPASPNEIKSYISGYIPGYEVIDKILGSKGKTYGLYCNTLLFYGKGKLIGEWVGRANYRNMLKYSGNSDKVYNYLKSLNAENLLICKADIIPDSDSLARYTPAINFEKQMGAINTSQFRQIDSNKRLKKTYEDDYIVFYRLK